jgi:hypothetical protein
MTRKSFLVLVVALAWIVSAQTSSAQVDISGTWIVTVDSPQGQMQIDTNFKQVGEKVTGDVTSPMGSVEFAGTLVKDELTVTYSVPVQGQTLEIRMTGKVADDTIAGALELAGMGQVPWSAKRKPANAAAATPPAGAVAVSAAPSTNGAAASSGVTGKWNITVQMGPNAMPLTAALKQDGEAVTGSIGSPLGDLPVTGTMIGTTLKLQFTAQTPQGDMAVTMTGELGPDGLAGKTSVAGLGESDWSAKRAD